MKPVASTRTMSPGRQSLRLGTYVPGHPAGTGFSRLVRPSPCAAASSCDGRTELAKNLGAKHAGEPQSHDTAYPLALSQELRPQASRMLCNCIQVAFAVSDLGLVVCRDDSHYRPVYLTGLVLFPRLATERGVLDHMWHKRLIAPALSGSQRRNELPPVGVGTYTGKWRCCAATNLRTRQTRPLSRLSETIQRASGGNPERLPPSRKACRAEVRSAPPSKIGRPPRDRRRVHFWARQPYAQK